MARNIIVVLIVAMLCTCTYNMGWQNARRNVEQEIFVAQDSMVREVTTSLFADTSYKWLRRHRISLPEEFGNIGAYKSDIKFPLIAYCDSNDVIQIEFTEKSDTIIGKYLMKRTRPPYPMPRVLPNGDIIDN
jgi:hypothetical protein